MKPHRVKTAERQLLSTEQVAALLAVTPKTVRRWIVSGELPARKLHRQWRVRAGDLERMLGPRDAT